MGDQSGYITRTASSTGSEPNLIQHLGGSNFVSTAEGDDEDLIGTVNPQVGQAPSSPVLEEHGP